MEGAGKGTAVRQRCEGREGVAARLHPFFALICLVVQIVHGPNARCWERAWHAHRRGVEMLDFHHRIHEDDHVSSPPRVTTSADIPSTK